MQELDFRFNALNSYSVLDAGPHVGANGRDNPISQITGVFQRAAAGGAEWPRALFRCQSNESHCRPSTLGVQRRSLNSEVAAPDRSD